MNTIHWVVKPYNHPTESSKKDNPLILLADDPEKGKFRFWAIEELAAAENLLVQIKMDRTAAGLTSDDPPDFVFIDDFSSELLKNPWLAGELTNCRNQGIYVCILAQNMDNQTGLAHTLLPNIDCFVLFKKCRRQIHLIIKPEKAILVAGKWAKKTASGTNAVLKEVFDTCTEGSDSSFCFINRVHTKADGCGLYLKNFEGEVSPLNPRQVLPLPDGYELPPPVFFSKDVASVRQWHHAMESGSIIIQPKSAIAPLSANEQPPANEQPASRTQRHEANRKKQQENATKKKLMRIEQFLTYDESCTSADQCLTVCRPLYSSFLYSSFTAEKRCPRYRPQAEVAVEYQGGYVQALHMHAVDVAAKEGVRFSVQQETALLDSR